MKKSIFLIPLACVLVLAGCQSNSTTVKMTPRIPVYNSQGLPGPEHSRGHQTILDHEVVVKDGWLQPWLDYDSLMVWSMNFLIDGPLFDMPEGLLPGYIVTSSFGTYRGAYVDVLPEDRIYRERRVVNNQGSNAYFAMKLFRYYYPYTLVRKSVAVIFWICTKVRIQSVSATSARIQTLSVALTLVSISVLD